MTLGQLPTLIIPLYNGKRDVKEEVLPPSRGCLCVWEDNQAGSAPPPPCPIRATAATSIGGQGGLEAELEPPGGREKCTIEEVVVGALGLLAW